MFECQECGHKFRTAKSVQRAINNGCPRCNGTDIDIRPKFDVRQAALQHPRNGGPAMFVTKSPF